MKIYDCCIYNGEDEVLDIRLNELDPLVDVFVIAECDVSFSGEQKGYRFNLEKFKKFSNKIRHIKVEDGLADYTNKSYCRFFQEDKWKREFHLRNSITRGLHDADPNDIVLLSDVDEIPILEKINRNKDLFIFKQICFQFKFNLMNEGMTPFFGTSGVKFKYLTTPVELRLQGQTHLGITDYKELNQQKIMFGGWHFSFCLPIENILEKIRFYSHNERIYSHNEENALVNKEHIENSITGRTDIWNGRYNYAKQSNRLIKLDMSRLPKYIQDNQDKFKEFLA